MRTDLEWILDDSRATGDGFSALLAPASATRTERLRSPLVPGIDWTPALQGAGTRRARPRPAPENLRSARQPGGKRLRASDPGEDQTVLRRRAEPGASELPGAPLAGVAARAERSESPVRHTGHRSHQRVFGRARRTRHAGLPAHRQRSRADRHSVPPHAL